MTVAELIAELQKFSPETRVVIEGYMKWTEDYNYSYNIEAVEGTRNDDRGDCVVIWASIVTEAVGGEIE